jgi:hypothetical protein
MRRDKTVARILFILSVVHVAVAAPAVVSRRFLDEAEGLTPALEKRVNSNGEWSLDSYSLLLPGSMVSINPDPGSDSKESANSPELASGSSRYSKEPMDFKSDRHFLASDGLGEPQYSTKLRPGSSSMHYDRAPVSAVPATQDKSAPESSTPPTHDDLPPDSGTSPTHDDSLPVSATLPTLDSFPPEPSTPPTHDDDLPPDSGTLPTHDDSLPVSTTSPTHDGFPPESATLPTHDDSPPDSGTLPTHDDSLPVSTTSPTHDGFPPESATLPTHDD